LRRVITAVALFAGAVTFVLSAGTGLFLAGVEQSGERGAGVLLALAGAVAFASLLFLAVARPAFFRRSGGKAMLGIATLLSAAPVGALAIAALYFVGIPFGSAVPRIDWTLFGVGLALAAGAAAITALGYLRFKDTGARSNAGRPEAALDAPLATDQARRPFDADRGSIEIDDEVRVRRVR
jgi:amino acid transporter